LRATYEEEPVVRYLADACLHEAIVTGCLRREPGLDFLSANKASLAAMSDPEILSLAALQGRVLVTSDWKTVANVIEALVLVWSASQADEWTNRILQMPPPVHPRQA
jgi:Domain of unknown function (DUF5615)